MPCGSHRFTDPSCLHCTVVKGQDAAQRREDARIATAKRAAKRRAKDARDAEWAAGKPARDRVERERAQARERNAAAKKERQAHQRAQMGANPAPAIHPVLDRLVQLIAAVFLVALLGGCLVVLYVIASLFGLA
ncbi:hypothetical protein KG112_18230 [Nocardioides sp. zg-ZUI104]|uniref:hypothetical protein n=1 Tax=Nocardioides faecalis TaxID=2803858 RepID=UPI001BD0E7FF|nr:hypothetical protein [Nocardioides faecalis]MBS4754743.1 hypothetical protein [Nocardioides faecalis]